MGRRNLRKINKITVNKIVGKPVSQNLTKVNDLTDIPKILLIYSCKGVGIIKLPKVPKGLKKYNGWKFTNRLTKFIGELN